MKTVKLTLKNKNLELKPKGTVTRGSHLAKNIKWVIENGLLIKDFKLISKSDPIPFTTTIPQNFQTSVQLSVRNGQKKMDWVYGIIWRDASGTEHTLDPILAIRPGHVGDIIGFIGNKSLVRVMLFILGLFGLRKMIRARK